MTQLEKIKAENIIRFAAAHPSECPNINLLVDYLREKTYQERWSAFYFNTTMIITTVIICRIFF